MNNPVDESECFHPPLLKSTGLKTVAPGPPGPTWAHMGPPLSHAPPSLSAALSVSWEGASAAAAEGVWHWPIEDFLPPRPRHCQLCLLGLERVAGGGEAATWSHGGSGGCDGGGGALTSALRAGSGSRRRQRIQRRGEEVAEARVRSDAGSGSADTPGRFAHGCSSAGSCAVGREEPPGLMQEEGAAACWWWRPAAPAGASVVLGPNQDILPYLPPLLPAHPSAGRRCCTVSRC